jgi:hypothetical protein
MSHGLSSLLLEGESVGTRPRDLRRDRPVAREQVFTKLGFSFDEQFKDENATRMIVSDDTSVMLAVEPLFRGFIEPQEIADTSRSAEVILGCLPRAGSRSTSSRTRRSPPRDRPWPSRRTTASCTCGDSATSTGMSGSSSTWTRPRFSADHEMATTSEQRPAEPEIRALIGGGRGRSSPEISNELDRRAPQEGAGWCRTSSTWARLADGGNVDEPDRRRKT